MGKDIVETYLIPGENEYQGKAFHVTIGYASYLGKDLTGLPTGTHNILRVFYLMRGVTIIGSKHPAHLLYNSDPKKRLMLPASH